MFKISERFKRIIALVVAVLFALLMLSTVFISLTSADQKNELSNKQQSLSSDKAEIKQEIEGLENQEKDVMAQKKELDNQVNVLEGEIDDINVEIDGFQKEIDLAQQELDDAQARLEAKHETYKTRVRVMYENSSVGYLDILLSAESIGDFFDKLEIVSQIAEYDNNILDGIKAEKAKIQERKEGLETLQNELVESKNVLLNKKSVLDSKMAERDSLIRKIQSSKSELEKELEKIEAEEAAVRAQIARLSGGSGTVYSGGSMLWPTPSCRTITSYYGWRLHPVLKYEKLHTGIDIGAGHGAKIIAAQSGKVITATYNGAYGNYVVVDHGGGVCTLYAHMSSMAASVGQSVSAGDVIGYVGSTGYSTGPHLHFEVIINGSTVDPLGYIG